MADKNQIHPFDGVAESNANAKENKEEQEERQNWSGKLDFFLSALSYSVGLGAVWRFPYLCYKNGGGAFLVPFFIFMIFVGVPIMFLELSVGQFMSRGPIASWVMIPLFRGVGISMNMINNYVNVYYIMIIAYSLYYLVLSVNTELPWAKCNPAWSSPNCVDDFTKETGNFTFAACLNKTAGEIQCPDGQCYVPEDLTALLPFNLTAEVTCGNESAFQLFSIGYYNPTFPSQDFWNNYVLQKSDDMNEPGGFVWRLVLALFIAWIVCFLCLFRGVKLSGKIVYFTALFPYLVLFILGVRGWMLDGAEIGIRYYIIPDWSRLSEAQVWTDAAVQVFFTLSLSYGGLVALSSYNRFDHNILRDTFILSVTNFFTCILAGFVVFGYMGALSKQTGLDIDKVVQSGQGLVYVVYPYAATTLAWSPLWAIMFFIMMLALGMGTMMASVETLTTSLEDFFPWLKSSQKIKAVTLLIVCSIYFAAGLILCTEVGTYWIDMLDEYSANWSILLIAVCECVTVGWFYGTKRFAVDISAMFADPLQKKLAMLSFKWWTICWTVVTPGLLVGLSVFTWIQSGRLESSDGYVFPWWTEWLGNGLGLSSISCTFIWMIYIVAKTALAGKPLADLCRPSKDWRPLRESDFDKVLKAREEEIVKHGKVYKA